jgi:drug/metabolite transporter (DMT)-like permease
MTSSWMLVAGFFFAAAGMFVKIGSIDFGAAELAFYRCIFTAVVAYAYIRATGGTVKSRYIGTHLLRSLLGAVSLIGYFYAITQLPLATAVTLNYTSPLFLAVTTTVVLGERFSPWLIFAIALGFGGVTMLLQPNFEEGKAGAAMIGLFSGVVASWAYLSVRTLGRLGEPDWRVVFWFGAVGAAICAGWQLVTAGFHAVRWANAWVLLGLGVSGVLAQLAMTRAYRTGNTLVVGAFSYSAIVFGTIATIAIWRDTLSGFAWIGMAVIIAAGILAMRVEKKEQVPKATLEA